jgi:hypothetical protein
MRAAAVAGVVVAVVLTAGFALQASGLPPAARGDVIAARAGQWLQRYRFAASTLTLGARTVRGRCYHGWFGGPILHGEHGTILALSDGAVVAALAHERLATGLRRTRLSSLDALQLAGCTEVLGATLESLALTASVHVHRELLWHRSVLALGFGKLRVLVDPLTDRPLGVELGPMRSRIRLLRLSPALERSLEALS